MITAKYAIHNVGTSCTCRLKAAFRTEWNAAFRRRRHAINYDVVYKYANKSGWTTCVCIAATIWMSSALGADTPTPPTDRAARLESARSEIALTRSNIVLTLDQLDQVRKAEDPHAQFQRFAEQLEKMKERAKLTQERAQAMKAKGDAYFAGSEVGAAPTPAQRKSYDQMVQQMQLARTNFTPLLAELEQIKTILEGERSKEQIAAAKDLFMQANWHCVSVQRALMNAEHDLDALAATFSRKEPGK